MLQTAADAHDGDPFWSHFPKLKSELVNTASGRRAGELRALAEDPRLFQNWTIKMRYAPTDDIDPKWIDQWRRNAEELVDRMNV